MRETHVPLESVWERLVRAVEEGSNIEYATNTYKKYFYTFRIRKITFTYGERNKERPNVYGMFSQNLPISAAFTAILIKVLCELTRKLTDDLHDFLDYV